MLAAVRVLDIGRKDSTPTSGVDEVENRPGRPHLLALERMQMKGVLMPQVVILRPESTKCRIGYMVELVSGINE